MIEFFPAREIVVEVGTMSVRWYGLLYVAAFWLGWWWLPRLARYRGLKLTRDDVSYITAWIAAGVIIGGRLGYVLLYEPAYYFAHPAEVFLLGHGGMSSHGGFIGVAIALWLASRRFQRTIPRPPGVEWFLALADVLVVPVAFGLALGRVGNFINQELYHGYWALAVAGADALLGFGCWYLLAQKKVPAGKVTAAFLFGYGIIRFLNELVRVDPWPHVGGLTYGQVLTMPILIVGLWLILTDGRTLGIYGDKGSGKTTS